VAAALPAGQVDLAFADPPFNTGYGYDVYEDAVTDEEYLHWTARWVAAVRRLLKPTGSLYVAIGTALQAEVKRVLDAGGLHWRRTLCWHYTFGPRQERNWTPSWVAIHYHVVDPGAYTWEPGGVRVPSARQVKYGDRRARAGGKVPNDVWVLDPATCPGAFGPGADSLLASRVCGTFKERTGHPCQMPRAVLDRIVAASSRPGDLVLDPFTGSGTTGAAALAAGRRFIGIELSAAYLRDIVVPRLGGGGV
jgi:hypothetical protein